MRGYWLEKWLWLQLFIWLLIAVILLTSCIGNGIEPNPRPTPWDNYPRQPWSPFRNCPPWEYDNGDRCVDPQPRHQPERHRG